MITKDGRIEPPYEWDEADKLEQEPEAGLYFSTGYSVKQATKVTEQRAYYDKGRRSWGNATSEGWKALTDIVAWGRTPEECKARADTYLDLNGEKRVLQRRAEDFVRQGLEARCRQLWDEAVEKFGAELDAYSIEVKEKTGYSDHFVARGIRTVGLRVWPKDR